MWETWVQSLGQEDPLEKEMAIHSSTLAWKIPWTEEPGGLQSLGREESDATERLHFHRPFCNPLARSPPGSSVCGSLQARTLEWVAMPLQGIFPTQGWNPRLLHCRRILYHLSHQVPAKGQTVSIWGWICLTVSDAATQHTDENGR